MATLLDLTPLSEATLEGIAEQLLAVSGGAGSKACFPTPFGICCLSASTGSQSTPVASLAETKLSDLFDKILNGYNVVARAAFPPDVKFSSEKTVTLPPVRGFLDDGACDLIVYIEW